MRKTAEEKKLALIEGLVTAREGLIDTTRALPEDCADAVFLGVWSIKDLLAHLIGWDETNLRAVQAILAGRGPDFFDYYDKDWQRYNHTLVEGYRKDSLDALLADAEVSHRRFVEYLSALPARDVVHGKAARPSGRSVSVHALLRAEAGDEAAHMEQVKAYFHAR